MVASHPRPGGPDVPCTPNHVSILRSPQNLAARSFHFYFFNVLFCSLHFLGMDEPRAARREDHDPVDSNAWDWCVCADGSGLDMPLKKVEKVQTFKSQMLHDLCPTSCLQQGAEHVALFTIYAVRTHSRNKTCCCYPAVLSIHDHRYFHFCRRTQANRSCETRILG